MEKQESRHYIKKLNRGHKLFFFNFNNNTITEVLIPKSLGNKIFVESLDGVYISALNIKNAVKHLEKHFNLKLIYGPDSENLKNNDPPVNADSVDPS